MRDSPRFVRRLRAVVRMLGNPATAKETVNVVGKPEYADAQKKLRAELDAWMARTGDPCAFSNDDRW